MAQETLVVVGDRFEEFLANPGTIPVSVLRRRLRRAGTEDLVIAFGQGLTGAQVEELTGLVRRGDGRVRLAQPPPVAAGRGLTHKHDRCNVLIGEPVRVTATAFVADLVVDERTETLADHLTGQHIPGIALTEAARQMWTAVTEKYLLDPDTRTRFVLNELRSVFHSYVFPLPATVRYDLLDHERTPVGDRFRCRVTIRQGERVAAEVDGTYHVVMAKISAKQEAMAARRAVRAEVAGRSLDKSA